MCYDHSSTTTAQKLHQCIENQEEVEELLVDEFGMTAFHVLFSSTEPRRELLKVLLDKFPYYVLGLKDVNGKLAMDYLVINWTQNNKILLQMTLQSCMLSRLERWGATSWMDDMQSKIQAILAEDDKERRMTIFSEACSIMKEYENVEATSILEMALWKGKLKSGWKNGGGKRPALDRGECRCFCGSNVVIPSVAVFLGIATTHNS
eukprot:CAMPEP_0113614136 /NCGR_PEP_ID=MMETSP0017_2-20120614/7005_1 /TAXON_ID=2856 /ORGANISM="Cylindrotheca closterium" /LENGTH=205 /DNA_ID=CAMNT_0000523283 /DNA_START=672 /DNA_END=1289 /DNA_ORIENTATION=- /assembly_acc=CAM_ASM_000147